jgi:ATP-dependent Clp protease adaptor protein ClpS
MTTETTPTETTPTSTTDVDTNTKTIPPWNVILVNDDDHSFDYVIMMLISVFGFPPTRGMQHAEEVDVAGRAILVTTSQELAELRQEQIHSFGPDPLVKHCKGSMTCDIEPA